MGKAKEQVVVKKITPYPFAANLEVEGKKMNVKVRKLTMTGFIANLTQGFVKVGEEYKSQMELPVLGNWINARVKVMKTYDQFNDAADPTSRVDRFAEFHFLDLTEEYKVNINRFMSTIRQA